MKEVNPDDYPHRLFWEGDHVYLVSRDDDGQDTRRDLGTATVLKEGYRRWDHLRRDHSQNDANMFLWGFVTGMQVSLWNDIDSFLSGRDR